MEKGNKISSFFRQAIKNRGLRQEDVAKRMGVSKQNISFVLMNRVDRNWTDKEIDYWCKVLRIDSSKVYELRERINEEVGK